MEATNKSIWILNHYAITPSFPGGTRHYDMGKELAKRGYQITIFASDFIHYIYRYNKTTERKKVVEEDIDGIKWIWIRTYPYSGNNRQRVINMIDFAWRAFWMALMRRNRPDFVIGSSPHLLTGFSAWLLARLKRAKFIFEVRDLWPQSLIDLGEFRKGNPFIWILHQLEKFLYRKAKIIITLLPGVKNYLREVGVEEQKVEWIPNGVDVSLFGEIPEDNKGDVDKFVVMYTGAHGRANALDIIIDAAARMEKSLGKKISFVLVGDGPEKKNLIRRAKDLDLSNVEFWEAVSKEKVGEVMERADVFVLCLESLPVFKYGISPNKLFTYMIVGKPVIFAVNSLNNPVAEAGAGLTVPSRNPQAIAEAVVKLFGMTPEERKKMGMAGREYVKENYDMKVFADKLEEILERLGKRK